MPGQAFLRFFLSAADQARIDPASIVVEDIPYAAEPAANEPYPQSLRVRFRITNPQAGPPMIRPLFPGQMTFIRDRSAPGRLPAPGEVRFTDEAYATWPTLGRLMIKAQKAVTPRLDARGAPEVIPNTVWFSGVRASRRFLFEHLPHGLRRASIAGTPTILASSQDWPQHVVSRFLEGQYEPILEPEADIAVARRVELPTVDMAADGTVSLVITTARLQSKAFDGPLAKFDSIAAGIPGHDPAHPCYGVVPARLVYRSWRADMLDAEPGNVLADAVLADWPRAPRYFPLRFTRIWKPEPECSVLLPEQRVQAVYDDGSTPPVVQRLPAHGVFYLAQPPRTPEPAPPRVQLSVLGGMRWMRGKHDEEQAEAWQRKAGTAPLPMTLGEGIPHIILRRPFTEEMLVERWPRVRGRWLCTYLSMRRTLRAFIDLRISGGRLRFGSSTSEETCRLINEALGRPNAARSVANEQPPLIGINSETGGTHLLKIFKMLFPAAAQAQQGCQPAPTADWLEGNVGYSLWQSAYEHFMDDTTRCYLGEAFIGRGGPGAAAALGLAEIIDNPAANESTTQTEVQERLKEALLDGGLQPGAILQFWWSSADFDRMRRREQPEAADGHSPVFHSYVFDATGTTRIGVRVIDQNGTREFEPGAQDDYYYLDNKEIWLAANWTE